MTNHQDLTERRLTIENTFLAMLLLVSCMLLASYFPVSSAVNGASGGILLLLSITLLNNYRQNIVGRILGFVPVFSYLGASMCATDVQRALAVTLSLIVFLACAFHSVRQRFGARSGNL